MDEEGWAEGLSQVKARRQPLPSRPPGFASSTGLISISHSETSLKKLILVITVEGLPRCEKGSSVLTSMKSFGDNDVGCQLWRQAETPLES